MPADALLALVAFWAPPGATLQDQVAAYGAVALLVALVCWQVRGSQDPPRS